MQEQLAAQIISAVVEAMQPRGAAVEVFTRRLHVQERLTAQIVDVVVDAV